MAKKAKKVPFDPKVFLASVSGGRAIVSYRKGEVIFSQGQPADAVFYIQKGKVKITVILPKSNRIRAATGWRFMDLAANFAVR
jgi:CRP-like cAMP-binding protein